MKHIKTFEKNNLNIKETNMFAKHVSRSKDTTLAIQLFTITAIQVEDDERDFVVAITGSPLNYAVILYKKSTERIPSDFKVHKNDIALGRLTDIKKDIKGWLEKIKYYGIKGARNHDIFRHLTRHLDFETLSKKNYIFKDYIKKQFTLPDPYLSLFSLLQKQGIPTDREEEILLLSHGYRDGETRLFFFFLVAFLSDFLIFQQRDFFNILTFFNEIQFIALT